MNKFIEKWKSLQVRQRIIILILLFSMILFLLHPKIFGIFINIYKNHLFLFVIMFLLVPLYIFFFPIKFPKFQREYKCQKIITVINIKNKAKKETIIPVLLILSLLLGLRVTWMFNKKSFFIDEWMSVVICNRNTHGGFGDVSFDLKTEYTGKEIREMSLFDSDSVTDAIKDIYNLHVDTQDSPHPNLYYVLLRLWFTGIKSSNPTFIMRWGIILNLLFFLVSFYAMFVLLLELCDSKKFIFIILIIAFANPLTISNTLLLRPYALQETLFILFSLCFVFCVKTIANRQSFCSIENFVLLSVITSLFMLTQYFSLLYIALLGLVLLVILAYYKQNTYAPFFIFMMIVAFILCKLFYQKYGTGLFDFRGKEAISKYSLDYMTKNVGIILNNFKYIIIKDAVQIKIAVALELLYLVYVIFIAKNDNKDKKIIILTLFLTSIVFSFMAIYSAPYKTSRYFVAAVPMFASIFSYDINYNFKFRKYNIPVSLSITGVIAILLVSTVLPISNNKKYIEYLNDTDIENYTFLNDYKKSVVIYCNYQWELSVLAPYFKDEQEIFFINNIDSIEELRLTPTYYVLISSGNYSKIPQIKNIIWENNSEIAFFTELLCESNK